MVTAIALLRGVNVGGKHQISMEVLRTMCEGLGASAPRTYVQSGNVVFRIRERAISGFGQKLEKAIEDALGFRPTVVMRTARELAEAAGGCPIAKRAGMEPAKLAVVFLAKEPGEAACNKVAGLAGGPEEVYMGSREIYAYFPDGMGRPKVTLTAIEKAAGVPGTARNWNTVQKLLEIAGQVTP